jgi:hypothetical protein
MRTIAIAAALAVLAGVAQMALAADESVIKYNGTKQGSVGGHPCLVILYTPAAGGNPASMLVPNKNPMGTKLDPSDVVTDALKDVKPGDYFDVTTTKDSQGTWVATIKSYTLTPGEDEPGVFLFSAKDEQKVGPDTFTSITVTKLKQTFTMLVPNKKGADGKPAPDEAIMKVITAAKVGDTLEIAGAKMGANTMIKTIAPWVAPRKVEFVKLTPKAKADDNASIDVTDSGNTQTISINAKGPDAATLMKKVSAIKAGQAIMIRTTTDDKGTWLTDVRPAPKEDTPAPTKK